MDGGVSFGQYSLYLVKIERAFEINNIQRDDVTCDIDETQLSRSFGEGQVQSSWSGGSDGTRTRGLLLPSGTSCEIECDDRFSGESSGLRRWNLLFLPVTSTCETGMRRVESALDML